MKHTYIVLHTYTHLLVSLFWPTGSFQPNRPFLFLIVSAKTCSWSCSVSVCRCLWVPSCMFLLPSISFSMFLCFSFGSSCSLPSSLFCFFCLYFSFTLSSSYSLFPISVLTGGMVLYASQLLPLTLSHHDGGLPQHNSFSMSAAEHGRPRLMQSLSTFSQLTVEELIHLHKCGCTAGFGLIRFQSNQFWKQYQDPACVLKSRPEFQSQV